MTGPVVVVGAGQAGFQVALSLREGGHEGPVTLVGDESHPPYQRPPLSKNYLGDDEPSGDLVALRPTTFYEERDITVRTGQRVAEIDRAQHDAVLESGERLGYGRLVLATGADVVALSVPGAELDGVLALRTVHDAQLLRERLRAVGRMVVIGGGFIGMEVAAAAARAGQHVTVLEAADRIMGRVVAPEISEHLHRRHRAQSVEVRTGALVTALHGDGTVREVELADGTKIGADTVVVGVGVRPRVDLAEQAGLTIAGPPGGIVVDDRLVTDDPAISAIGDCAYYPNAHAGAYTRLESVQNAVDHARHLAARLLGADPGPYRSVPWFWTHQYDCNVQTAGIGHPDDQRLILGDPASGKFSIARFRAGTLACVESVNSPADHMATRKILGGAVPSPTFADAAGEGFSLKQFIHGAPRAADALTST